MKPVLMTVSSNIPPNLQDEIIRGERPRPDYWVMAEAFQADLLDYTRARKASGWVGRLLEKISGPELMLAWATFQQRKQYRAIFTDGEQIGIPLAWMLKFMNLHPRPYHMMLSHVLSVKKKMLLLKTFDLKTHIDQFVVLSSFQKNFATEQLGIPPERVFFTRFMVDSQFYQASQVGESNPFTNLFGDRPLICSIGREFRDYATLIEAVRGLDVELIITTASPWSKRSDTSQAHELPANVHLNRFSYPDLRALYASSRFLVMPLFNVQFQAGVTAILEAMAMGKAVICTQVPGQTDIVENEKTGLYVPPGNAPALRATIQYLLDHPDQADRMGRNGRKRVLKELNLDCYAMGLSQQIASHVSS